jgi:hypothetical protein
MDSNTENYINAFGDPILESGIYQKDSRLAKAYEVALDIRKFEIDLYWKRSGSFWLLVGAIATALGLLLSGKTDSSTSVLSQRGREFVCCLLCASGATICYAWNLVNKGSKFWQRNWEYQVGILEQKVVGPLYKTVMSAPDDKIMYSVSEINGYISKYFLCVFCVGAAVLMIGSDGKDFLNNLVIFKFNSEAIVFTIKLIVVFLHFWFVFEVKKSSGHHREPGKSFNNTVEVSIRKISIGKIFGDNGIEKEIWVPSKNDGTLQKSQRKFSLFSFFFSKSKSDKK